MADRLYDYTNSREGVHQGQLFSGNRNTKLSAEDLRKEFEADSNVQLRNAFGSFDNYLAYMDERQDLIDSGGLKADWWDTGDPLFNPETGYEVINEGDPNVDYKEQMMTLSAGGYNSQSAMHDLYTKYTGQDITEAQTNEQGDTYRWNGTSYVKTFTNDGGFAKDLTLALMTAALGSAASPLLASKLGATGLGAGVSKGVAAGALNAGGQLALTGEIDPKSVLASGLIAGLNPGGTVADKYTPWKNADGEWAFGGAPPSTFAGGMISGTINDLVSTGIIEGKIDLGNSLEKGLISGGVNSALNTLDEWKNNSQEGIADRLQHQDPYKYPDTEAGRALAMQDALNDPLLNTTDFGALIGDEGLLPFIPRADLGFLRGIVDPITDGIDGILNGFELSDHVELADGSIIDTKGMTDEEIFQLMHIEHPVYGWIKREGVTLIGRETMGLLNNPVVDGAANLLGGLLPAGDGSLSEDLQSQKDQYDQEFLDQPFKKEELDKYFDKYGNLTVAGKVAQNDFTQLKMDTLGSFYFENSGGLNEDYSWTDNPRGQSELWGTMAGLPGLYSTGAETSWLPNRLPNTISPPLLPDGTPVTPLNFGPEFVSPDYAVANPDPSSAILPSNDDAALRNWWLQQYYGYLQGNQGGGSDLSNVNLDTGITPIPDTDANVEVDTNTSVQVDTNNTNTNTNTNSTAPATDVDISASTAVPEQVVDSGGNTTPEAETTPIYNLPINDDGTATLPGGATVPANVADNIYEQTYLPPNYELAGGGNETLPGGGSTLPSGGKIKLKGGDGLPPLWTELFGYTRISPYKKARLNVLEGMLSGMAGGGQGLPALDFSGQKNPYQKVGKSLIDAGLEPRG